jgi:hypothetical protein
MAYKHDPSLTAAQRKAEVPAELKRFLDEAQGTQRAMEPLIRSAREAKRIAGVVQAHQEMMEEDVERLRLPFLIAEKSKREIAEERADRKLAEAELRKEMEELIKHEIERQRPQPPEAKTSIKAQVEDLEARFPPKKRGESIASRAERLSGLALKHDSIVIAAKSIRNCLYDGRRRPTKPKGG